MSKELGILNLVSILVGLLFIAFAVVTALFYPPLLSTDNLFIISVCLVMALLFMVNPLFYLHSEGRLPIPVRQAAGNNAAHAGGAGCGGAGYRYSAVARRQRPRCSSRRKIHDGEYEPQSERLVAGVRLWTN